MLSILDSTIEYDAEGKIYCKATGYPEVTVQWYHNDTMIEDSDNIEILPDENALVIKHMTFEDVGAYKCEVTNSIETKTLEFDIDISGLGKYTTIIMFNLFPIKYLFHFTV